MRARLIPLLTAVGALVWAIRMPLKRDATQAIFEFGCHEGNRGLENIMRAARAGERREAGEKR